MASTSENTAVVYITVISRLVVRLALIVATAYILWRSRSILISLLIAILLTYTLLPIIEWMCRKRMASMRPKTQRVIATIFVFCAFMVLTVACVAVIVTPFTREMQSFFKNFDAYGSQIKTVLNEIGIWYAHTVPSDVKNLLGTVRFTNLSSWLTTKVAPQALTVTTSWIHYAMELILIPVLAFYFALDYRALGREFYGLIPKKRVKEVMRLGRDASVILQSYVVGQLILCILAGVITAVFLKALGMPYVLVLALFAGVTRAIPVIGPVVSGIPIILVGLLNFQGFAVPAYLLLFVIVLHFAESKFIMPRLIGYRMHLHPAVVIVVLLLGAEFFGLIGMFLAAPVAAIIRELIRLYYIIPSQRSRQAIPADHIGAHTPIL